MSDLHRLAQAYGVAVGYLDQSGVHRDVSDATIAAVLRALGADPDSPEGIARSLVDVDLRDWRRILPPVYVTVTGQSRRTWVHVPHGSGLTGWIELEDGSRREAPQVDHYVEPRMVDGALIGEAALGIPSDLPLGWHTFHVNTTRGHASMPLVVTPAHLELARIGDSRAWGLMTQLYATRSRRSWGLGDLADLADLATWSGHELGADFVLVNPLHAAEPVAPLEPSPYLPTSRRFTNPIYLSIESIHEYGQLGPQQVAQVRALAAPLLRLDETSDLLDRDTVWAAKRRALDIVREVPLTPGRHAAFEAYVDREGQGLLDFATWSAMVEACGAPLGAPASPEVAEFAAAHAREIEFHCWMQWLLDEQLATVQLRAESAGMRIGIMHDLAVGVHPGGADAWALQDVLATGVSVGAPPDMYNQLGQDWSQPPWRPEALAEAAFIPYRNMLRTIMRHAGGLRIDHVLGLFRMWWIPRGMPANAGTYVIFDHAAMIGILALEAHRAGCVVIGEDLGTVEPWVQDVLADRGLLGTVILWFERDEVGAPLPPHRWRRDVLASVTVHDLPPTAGYLELEHVRIRAELGLLTTSEADERAAAEREISRWCDLLPDPTDPVVGLHHLVAASPARLIGVALPDLVGDRRAQNQPGTHREYPNWCVPLTDARGRAVCIDDLGTYDLVGRVTRALG